MISEELKKLIGVKGRPVKLLVNLTELRRFADASDNRHPLYWDDEYARNTQFGGVVAPTDYFGWPETWEPVTLFPGTSGLFEVLMEGVNKAGYIRALNAGTEVDYYLPVRPGDTMIAESEILSIEEKEGKKGGKMLLSIIQITYTNQKGDVVARQRQTEIH